MEPVDRVRARILTLQTWGRPIELFKDVPELLTTFRNAIEGHERLFFSGVLYGDVSLSSLLVRSENENPRGCIIDFDKALITSNRTLPPPLGSTQDRELSSFIDIVAMVFGKVKATIDAEAAVKLMARFNGELDGAVEYIARVLNIWPLPQTQDTNKLTVDYLRLGQKEWPEYPHWDNHSVVNHALTGTKAFMSVEILWGIPLYCSGPKPTELEDRVVYHHLESFFWVLLYLCLTRKVPGGRLLNEPGPNAPVTDCAAKLNSVIYRLFHASDSWALLQNKDGIFKSNLLKTDVMPCFHSELESLKPFIVELWNTIRFGFITNDIVGPSTIHRLVLDVIETQEREIEGHLSGKVMDMPYAGRTIADIERCEDDFRGVRSEGH